MANVNDTIFWTDQPEIFTECEFYIRDIKIKMLNLTYSVFDFADAVNAFEETVAQYCFSHGCPFKSVTRTQIGPAEMQLEIRDKNDKSFGVGKIHQTN